jgi:hypothetical protein
MDNRNNDLRNNKSVSFVVWRYSKETRNYKITIDKLYLFKKLNKGRNKKFRPFKFYPMIQCSVLFLQTTGSKPFWKSIETFRNIEDAFECVINTCKIEMKKFNVYEELSRLIISSNQWQSLKQWLPNYFIEKCEIVNFIDEEDEKEIEEPENNKIEENSCNISDDDSYSSLRCKPPSPPLTVQ